MGYTHPTAIIGSCPEHRDVIRRCGHLTPEFLRAEGTFFYPSIDESAIVDAFCTVDAGLTRPTRIGADSWLQKHVHVGHDAQIGDDCEICVGVVICGNVKIGDGVRVGGNAWIRPRIAIGDGARIGGGSVVVKDVPAGAVVAGNPAKPLLKGREAQARGQLTAAPSSGDEHFHFNADSVPLIDPLYQEWIENRDQPRHPAA